MTDFDRLSSGGSADERALLRAGQNVRPSQASKQRALVGLGLVSATTFAPTTVAALLKTVKAAAGVSWPWLASKWTGAALIVTFGAGVAIVSARHSQTLPVPALRRAPAVELSDKQRSSPSLAIKPGADDARQVESEKPARTVVKTAAPSATPRNRLLPSAPTEVELLDVARTRLTAGDASGALKAIGNQLRAYPAGNLALEARVLRIEALDASGRRERAAAEARAFLAQNPAGLMSHRVRRWLEQRSIP